MIIFEDIQDVEEWLEPLNYIGFWEALAPYRIFGMDDRDHYDGVISSGQVKPDLVLDGLKIMARLELTDMFGLADRIYVPTVAQYINLVH